MPLNWAALRGQIPALVEAEQARRLRRAEQATRVAEALSADAGADPQAALAWLGTAMRAWEAVLEVYPEHSPRHLAAQQQRAALQANLLARLRQAEGSEGEAGARGPEGDA